MNCIDINEKMSLYIDHLLEASEKCDFEKHLSECSDCMEAYELISANIKLCNEIPELELPANFKDQFHTKLMAEKRKSNATKRNWRTYGVVAAALFIVFASTFQNMFSNKSTQDIAKKESSSIGSKWTLSNDSDESLKEQMSIAKVPEEEDAIEAPMSIMSGGVENTDTVADFAQDDTLKETEQDYGRRMDMLDDSSSSSDGTVKTYDGFISVQNDSLDQVMAFLDPFLLEHPNIIASSDSGSDDLKITLTMPTEIFMYSLDFVTQYSNVTGYNVDINDETVNNIEEETQNSTIIITIEE